MYSDNSTFERKNTLIGEIGSYMPTSEFIKLSDLEGDYAPNTLMCYGWVMFTDKFATEFATGLDKVNVYLVCIKISEPNKSLFVRLPKGVAKRLVEDFENASENGVTIENYVKPIKKVRTYKTKFGTKSATFESY